MAQQVTQLLQAWGQGDESARDRLIPLVYDELRRLARHYLSQERRNHTLQASALVNEAYLRLVKEEISWQSRSHFFGIAARLMRQILVEHARVHAAEKRGGEYEQVSLTAAEGIADAAATDILAVDMALEKLAAFAPQQSQIVELRFFGGLTIDEVAATVQLSTATIEREWRSARAWLRLELGAS